MSFLTRQQLLEYQPGTIKAARASTFRRREAKSDRPSVFLSHSHADRELVEPVANFLADLGVEVYVDWMDTRMPEVTSGETATLIRLMIKVYRRFLVLVTERSLASRWVPWELGYADGVKQPADLAVLPISESILVDAPNEYIQVYPRIEKATDQGWYVFAPNQ